MRYNRQFLLALLILGVLLSCTQTSQQEMSKKIWEKVKNATVRVENTKGGWGSGFFIAPDKIVTNIHVIVDPQGFYVKNITDTPYNIESVITSDPEHDLVILKVSGKGKPLELSEVQIGEWIFAAGYPRDKEKEYALEEGTASDIRNKGKQLWSEHNRALMKGMSGGPVVNSRGEVVGISVSAHWGGDSVTRQKLPPFFGSSASASVLEELLKRSKSSEPMSLSAWDDKPCIRAYGLNKAGKDKTEKANKKADAEKATLYNEAIKDFDEASKLCPNYAEAHFEFGMAKLSRDESDLSRDQCKAVIDSFTKVVELNQDYYKAYYGRGTVHLLLGKLETNMGNVKEARRHYNTAISDFNEGIKRIKVDATYYVNRAAAKIHLGELETDQERSVTLYHEAIADFKKAKELDPDVGK